MNTLSFITLLCLFAFCYGRCLEPKVRQTLQRSWYNNKVDEFSVWDVEIKNTGDEALLLVSLHISGEINQHWEIIKDSFGYALPAWRKTNGIPANEGHNFGYTAIGSEKHNITVSHYYCSPPNPEPVLFQVSTLQALSVGLLEGTYSVGHLKKKGDFGLGTYEGYNGEMIVLDGHVYHAYSNGSVEEAADYELSPFAAVVTFKSDSSYNITNTSTQAQLNTFIASIIPSDNFFYAIKIQGHFSSVTTRAIPLLTRPYPTLTEAEELQVVNTKENVEGTAVVIRGPQYTSNLNAAGDHFHYISDDRNFGGHSLNLTLTNGILEIQQIRKFKVWLPETDDFVQAELDN